MELRNLVTSKFDSAKFYRSGSKATWRREFKLSWRKAGPPNHLDDGVDLDQQVVNKEFFLLNPGSFHVRKQQVATVVVHAFTALSPVRKSASLGFAIGSIQRSRIRSEQPGCERVNSVSTRLRQS